MEKLIPPQVGRMALRIAAEYLHNIERPVFIDGKPINAGVFPYYSQAQGLEDILAELQEQEKHERTAERFGTGGNAGGFGAVRQGSGLDLAQRPAGPGPGERPDDAEAGTEIEPPHQEEGKTYHLSVHIDNALRQPNDRLSGIFEQNGRPMAAHEVRRMLIRDKNKGHTLYCPCDIRTPEGRCAGHTVIREDV